MASQCKTTALFTLENLPRVDWNFVLGSKPNYESKTNLIG